MPLDRFDEVTGPSIQGLWRKLRDNRYRAMEPIRRLVAEHPTGLGLAIAGRAHFFDTDAERRVAWGTAGILEASLVTSFEEPFPAELKGQQPCRCCSSCGSSRSPSAVS